MTDRVAPRLIDADAQIIHHEGTRVLFVANRNRMSDQGVCLPLSMVAVLERLDGRRSLLDLQAEVLEATGHRLEIKLIEQILHMLDGVFVLDTDNYRDRKREIKQAFLDSPVREPICAGGVYSEDPDDLTEELNAIYTRKGGAGSLPKVVKPTGSVRCVLAPHIDFRRGRQSFGFSFREIVEHSDATLFVIIGTSHYSLDRFILTRKDFRTPFGIAKTDQAYVDSIVQHFGESCFRDEMAHQPEHSIELEVVLLQHALAGRRDFRVVPLLVGSFGDRVDEQANPSDDPEISRMIESLREAEKESAERVCYIVSGDLAHIGPKFGDHWKIDDSKSEWCRRADDELLKTLESGNETDLFNFMAKEKDERRVCGFPPLYIALSVANPCRGRRLCYDQFVDPKGTEIVSFAAMAFDSE
jgi:AmmeMemoRadiSam system protein B